MAGVVKWLRPRIVVPIYVGSNPISRPIFKARTLVLAFLYVYRDGILTQNLLRKFKGSYLSRNDT